VRSLRRASFAVLATLLLASCGGTTDTGGPRLIVARVKDATGLDPAQQTDGLSFNITCEVFANLVRFKPGTFDVIPDIATMWHPSSDGKTWTFKLAHGLRFSDDTVLDAAAVRFNFLRWRDEKDPNHGSYSYGYYPSMFGGFDGASEITAVDAPRPDTVVLHLKTPFGPLLRDLAMAPFAIGSPKAIAAGVGIFNQQPVASGPYTVAEWVHDDHITLTANPTWHGHKPYYTTVYVRDIPDQSTGVLSLKTGDVDLLVDPRPDDARDLARQRGITVYHPASNDLAYLALNVDRPPFGNVLVRQAIDYAIDKAALVRGFYAEGAVVADNWTPPGMLGENPAVKARPHDVAKAKALLARAGMSHFATELYYPTSPRPYMPEPGRIAEAIAANLHDVGIEVTLEPFEFPVFLDKIRSGEHPMCLIGWTGDNGDPDNFTYPLLDQDSAVKGQAQNYSFWRDPRFHRLMLAGQRTSDEKRRAAIYRAANAMIADQAPAIALVHSVVSFAAKSSIGGVIARPDSEINFELLRPRGN
jgi:peptide/nickel transport system substrate-binding protein